MGSIHVGAIINRPLLSQQGLVVQSAVCNIPNHYSMIDIPKYVIMLSHIHIILLISNGQTNGRLVIVPTISTVIQQMKIYVSKQIGISIWQKSYYDHIIRNDDEYRQIWQYIDENPAKWAEDKYFVRT